MGLLRDIFDGAQYVGSELAKGTVNSVRNVGKNFTGAKPAPQVNHRQPPEISTAATYQRYKANPNSEEFSYKEFDPVVFNSYLGSKIYPERPKPIPINYSRIPNQTQTEFGRNIQDMYNGESELDYDLPFLRR